MMRWLRALRCLWGGCPGYVVSGWRGPVLHIGWRCSRCGKIKHYEPARRLPLPPQSTKEP